MSETTSSPGQIVGSGLTPGSDDEISVQSGGVTIDIDIDIDITIPGAPRPQLSGTTSNIVVSSGVTSTGITLSAGQTMSVLSGGTAAVTTVNNSATLIDNGRTISTTVNSGGLEAVVPGGISNNAVVNSG